MSTPTLDDTLRELGRWVMEAVQLRRALSDQQHETVRMAGKVGSLRKRHAKLTQTVVQQEENLIALNIRLMGKTVKRDAGAET